MCVCVVVTGPGWPRLSGGSAGGFGLLHPARSTGDCDGRSSDDMNRMSRITSAREYLFAVGQEVSKWCSRGPKIVPYDSSPGCAGQKSQCWG